MTDAYTLTVALGGRWASGRGVACCPAHEDRSPSLSLANGTGGQLLLHCHAGCSFKAVQDALRGRGLLDGSDAFRPVGEVLRAERLASERAYRLKRSRQARDLWNAARPLQGTPAETYLRARGIVCALAPSLRYVKNCWHCSAVRRPALVSYVTVPANHYDFAVHRTYVTEDGLRKASIAPNKAMLGPVAGGGVALSAGHGPLVVCEGIETGLSLLSGILDQPARVWAALSAGGLERLILPDSRGDLIIASDGDAVGRKAAETLATRAYGLGWRIALMPAPGGADWNDVLTGKVTAA